MGLWLSESGTESQGFSGFLECRAPINGCVDPTCRGYSATPQNQATAVAALIVRTMFALARFRAVASKIRLRKRRDLGVASTYSFESMYSIARSSDIERSFERNPFPFSLAAHVREMFRLARIHR